jgi:hypothetical protein
MGQGGAIMADDDRVLAGPVPEQGVIVRHAFSTFDDYLIAFEKALQAQVQAGYMLEGDEEVLLERQSVPSEHIHGKLLPSL